MNIDTVLWYQKYYSDLEYIWLFKNGMMFHILIFDTFYNK